MFFYYAKKDKIISNFESLQIKRHFDMLITKLYYIDNELSEFDGILMINNQ